jgi:transketolase
MELFDELREKAEWVWKETLMIHKVAPGIRLASSLSCIEILTVLYYGNILRFDPQNPYLEERDRLIISKAHGSVSLYPILADLGYFDKKYLSMVGLPGSILGDIPDCSIPGYETVNGSLGHGPGVACGMALGLKRKHRKEKVFVLLGDGELYEGSVWEAIMFAGHHRLDNLILIVDNNKICMLDYCTNILNLEPIDNKFKVFGWQGFIVDGHNIEDLHGLLLNVKNNSANVPTAIIANTIKGRGIPRLEQDPLCHIKALSHEEIDILLRKRVIN